MVKISENEVLLSRQELYALIGAAGVYYIDKTHMNKKSTALTEFSLEAFKNIRSLIEDQVWEGGNLLDEGMRKLLPVAEIEKEIKESERDIAIGDEDKQAIRMLLLVMLQKTRAYHDLKDLRDDPVYGTVAEFESGGTRRINTKADSGIAMINDILAHL